MPDNSSEEDLLRSIDEVEEKIKAFRKRVQGVLTDIQSVDEPAAENDDGQASSMGSAGT